MPPYQTNPIAGPPPPMLQPGVPVLAFGTLLHGHPTVRAYVTNVAITSNVATVTVQIMEGFIPAVGDLVSIVCSNSIFNVTDAVITAISITAATGAGTITFALTHADVGSVAASGTVLSTQSPVPLALTGSAQKSQQYAIQAAKGQGRGISWSYSCPSAPVSIAVQLEGAINDNDADYVLIGTSQTTAAGAQQLATAPVNCNFVRLQVTASSGGTLPTILGRILQS
jgi:hypothetical protein